MTVFNKEVGKRICELRKERNMSRADLGKKVDLHETTIKKYEDGKINSISTGIIEKFAKALQVNPLYIYGWDDLIAPLSYRQSIPVLRRVQAGIPLEAAEEIIGYEEITKNKASKGKYFALKVNDDSMEPKFSEGDIVIVKIQSNIKSGEIGIIVVNGEDATIRKVFKHKEGAISLRALNPKCAPVYFTSNEIVNKPVSIIGKVVELRARF